MIPGDYETSGCFLMTIPEVGDPETNGTTREI